MKNQTGYEFEYLCVDQFASELFQSLALAAAFRTGLIDYLLEKGSATLREIAAIAGGASGGVQLWVGILSGGGVLARTDGIYNLTSDFSGALKFRELLEMKLGLANFAGLDLIRNFGDLVSNPERFLMKSDFCRLFAYDRCFEPTPENRENTRRWMRITSILTSYESEACLKYHDFSRYRAILDVGGNSGELALRICRSNPSVRATVFDLPLVCEIGKTHVAGQPEAQRITFTSGNALTEDLPVGFDLVIFKSMLHDWPERQAEPSTGKSL